MTGYNLKKNIKIIKNINIFFELYESKIFISSKIKANFDEDFIKLICKILTLTNFDYISKVTASYRWNGIENLDTIEPTKIETIAQKKYERVKQWKNKIKNSLFKT